MPPLYLWQVAACIRILRRFHYRTHCNAIPTNAQLFQPESFTQAATVIHDFKRFIQEHIDELPALQILCKPSEVQGTLTDANLKEPEQALHQHSSSLSRESLWMAYQRRSPNNVHGTTTRPIRPHIISPFCYGI